MRLECTVFDAYDDAYNFLQENELLSTFVDDILSSPVYESKYLPTISNYFKLRELDPFDKVVVKEWLLDDEDDGADAIREMTEIGGADDTISEYYRVHIKKPGVCFDIRIDEYYELRQYDIVEESKEDTLKVLAGIIIENKVSLEELQQYIFDKLL